MQQDDHDVYREWLSLELDGELSERDRGRLRRHLAGCEECRRERRSLAALGELVADSRVAVRRGFRGEVMASLPAAGWEARHPRSWAASLLVVALLGGAAAALVGSSAARLEPAAPFLAAVSAVGDMLTSSALAGAGLLGASWMGLGLAFEQLLDSSLWNTLAFGILVVGANYLLYRLLQRRRPAAAAAISRATRDPQSAERD